jgi:excisionase family DNA binding protein
MNDIGSHSDAGGLKINLLKLPEVVKALRISKSGVYRLVESRKIRFYKVGGVLRFDAQDVEDFLRQGCVEPIS